MVKRVPRAKHGRGNEKVGYGKPPKHTRFKPGQSGNPNGRPKGTKNFASEIRDKLKSKVKVNKNGSPAKISAQLAGIEVLFAKAFAGDPRAIDLFVRLAEKYSQSAAETQDSLEVDDQEILDAYLSRMKES